MKKILVSGCINCPFLQVWNDGQGNGIDSITSGQCNHPSFHKELLKPKMSPNVFISYIPNSDSDIKNEWVDQGKIKTPDWCPLPND